MISASSFEKRGIQDLDKILEVILKKQRERQHYVNRCGGNSVSKSCVLEGCLCGIEEVRQTLKQVLCGGSKTQFVSFDQDLYDFIETNCHEKFEKLRNFFKKHETDYGFIIEFESTMDTSSGDLQSLLLDLKSQYQVLEFHETDVMTFEDIRGFMKGTETVSSGEVELVLDGDVRLVKIVGSRDAVFRTKQTYDEHVKAVASDSATPLNSLPRKNLENGFAEENPDDNDVHAREIRERNEGNRSDVLPTVNSIKPQEIEIVSRQNENIKTLEGINCGDENAFQTGEHYSEASHEEEKDQKATGRDIKTRILKTIDSVSTQNTSEIYDKLDMEKLYGEDEKIVKKETKCCEIEKIPEINGGVDNVFQTGDHCSECKEYSNQNTTDTEKNVDLLCDKTRISCSFVANYNETCSKGIVDDKENILSSMEDDINEPRTMTEMVKKALMESAPKENSALVLKIEDEIKPLFEKEIQRTSSEIVEPIANQNVNNIGKTLDRENLCGEEDKAAKNETNCCQIVADPKIISGEENALLTREQHDQSRNSEHQSSADTEKPFDLLICDKAKTSHANRGAINSEMIDDSIKERTMSFMEYGVEEPTKMKKMIAESEAEDINLISKVENAFLSRDQTNVKVRINEVLEHFSSETKGLDMHDCVTSTRMPLLQQYAEDGNSLGNGDHEDCTIETITGQQQPFSKHLVTYELISGREEISEAHQNVNVLNSKTTEAYVCRGKTDENVVPQLTLVQQSKTTEMAQISQVWDEIDESKSSQMESSTDNSVQAKQKYGANCSSSMTALDSNSRDSDEVKNAAVVCVTEETENKYEELSNNECDKLLGEETPEQRNNDKLGKIKQVLYHRREESSSEDLSGQEQKEITKEPNQLKNSECLGDDR